MEVHGWKESFCSPMAAAAGRLHAVLRFDRINSDFHHDSPLPSLLVSLTTEMVRDDHSTARPVQAEAAGGLKFFLIEENSGKKKG